MVKKRLAVTISPKLKRRDNLVTVVPLSADEPNPHEDWHVPINVDVPGYWGNVPRWAKCDMISTVGFARLNLPHEQNLNASGRKYLQIELTSDEVDRLRQAVAKALGMS